MHLAFEASGLLMLALGASALAQGDIAKRNSLRRLQARGGTPPPDHKPDDLPKPNDDPLVTWIDDDFDGDNYKKNPDYDPDQDKDFGDGKRKRSTLDKRVAPDKGTTDWLRSVTIDVNGEAKGYRDAFLASSDQKWITLSGKPSKDDRPQLGIIEQSSRWADPKPKPKNYKSPQADHVNDLGIYTNIAARAAPDGIDKGDWQTISDAILGGQNDNDISENTKTIGKELNDPANIRGILFTVNMFKNSIMGWAYTSQATKASYTAWSRSSIWGCYRYMKSTKDQFDEVTNKVTQAIEGIIMDEAQGKKIAEYYKAEIPKIYNRAIAEMERILKDGPANPNVPMKAQDCSNTKDSPNTPPSSPQPSASAGATSPQPTSQPPTTKPVDPPTRKACEPNPSNSVRDAHETSLVFVLRWYCKQLPGDAIKTNDVNIADTWTYDTVSGGHSAISIGRKYDAGRDGTDRDDVYDLSISSVKDCDPGSAGNLLKQPTPKSSCEDVFMEAWKGCTGNQGRGGSMNAGCLVYGVKTKF